MTDSPGEPESGLPPPEPKSLPGAAAFLGMGTTVAACIGVGVWLGVVADGHFNSAPVGLIAGLLLGVGAAVSSVVVQVRRFL